MGNKFLDQYTYLHFATGIVAYFFGISIKNWIIIHILFEIIENTKFGMKMINMFPYWPGGKKYSDTLNNMIGDTIGSILGWYSAKLLDELGNKYGLYSKHIN